MAGFKLPTRPKVVDGVSEDHTAIKKLRGELSALCRSPIPHSFLVST